MRKKFIGHRQVQCVRISDVSPAGKDQASLLLLAEEIRMIYCAIRPDFISNGSIETVDILGEGFAVVEMLIGIDDVIRLDAAVHIIVGAVLHEGQALGA